MRGVFAAVETLTLITSRCVLVLFTRLAVIYPVYNTHGRVSPSVLDSDLAQVRFSTRVGLTHWQVLILRTTERSAPRPHQRSLRKSLRLVTLWEDT